MIDERAFIAEVEAASPDRFAEILRQAGPDQERALRVHFGRVEFERLRDLAQMQRAERGLEAAKGNVVVLHGIMGGVLGDGSGSLWLNLLRLLIGQFDQLALDDAGKSVRPLQATAILKKYYGTMLVSLSKSWKTQAFWYDWRLDIRETANLLADRILDWFGPGVPVHLIAHSMGGLVARAMIKRRPEVWEGMKPGRLIMLGTPNHGSFAIPIMYSGLDGSVRSLAELDQVHDIFGLLTTAKTFVGTYQMLPSLLEMPELQRLYVPETYGSLRPPQNRFEDAQAFHEYIKDVIDPARMIYVAGYNRRTAKGIADWGKLTSFEGYRMTLRGDGTVPHALGLLKGVTTFYVDEQHGSLPNNPSVLQAMDRLLLEGTADEPLLWHGLADDVAEDTRALEPGPDEAGMQQAKEAEAAAAPEKVRVLKTELTARAGDAPLVVTPHESEIRDVILAGFLDTSTTAAPATGPETAARGLGAAADAAVAAKTLPKAQAGTIRVRVAVGGIEKAGTEEAEKDTPPVDAISVGHYVGVRPQFAELAIDRALSREYRGKTDSDTEVGEADLLLTQFTERGIVRGELGQPMFLPDPRQAGRIVAVAGMGLPGRFGVPELSVLSRELAWSLGRLGKRHLATVLIGAGARNLTVRDAVHGWMRGLQRATSESPEDQARRLEVVTFYETGEKRGCEIRNALRAEKAQLATEGFEMVLGFPEEPEHEKKEREEESDVATQLSIELVNGIYRFGAITRNAAIPERDVAVDPVLVREANDRLAAERDPAKQAERGEFLLKLMVPRELQPMLTGSAPVVLSCDTNVAQIHWEIMAQPHDEGDWAPAEGNFLGLYRGVTRQLRTSFAPPPEPPPPPSRELRILVVADTAAEARLPGAQAEAYELAKLFQKVNERKSGSCSRAAVVTLIGPEQANRPDVLWMLMRHPPFDIFHFAGHCVYDREHPEKSGWIFSGKTRLTANELERIDRIPKFVFSNACESGITPSRSEMRSPELAPTFAEAFFGRGVSNFICTAWPVGDDAARRFATRLYSGLLGLEGDGGPEPMHIALREARRVLEKASHDARTWGAYQHYGNPHFRLCR